GVGNGALGAKGTEKRCTPPSRAGNRWNSSEPRLSSEYLWSQFASASHAGPTGTGPDDEGAGPPGNDAHSFARSAAARSANRLWSAKSIFFIESVVNPPFSAVSNASRVRGER